MHLYVRGGGQLKLFVYLFEEARVGGKKRFDGRRLGPLRTGGSVSMDFSPKCPLCPLESGFWGRNWEDARFFVRIVRVLEQGEEGAQIVFRRPAI